MKATTNASAIAATPPASRLKGKGMLNPKMYCCAVPVDAGRLTAPVTYAPRATNPM